MCTSKKIPAFKITIGTSGWAIIIKSVDQIKSKRSREMSPQTSLLPVIFASKISTGLV